MDIKFEVIKKIAEARFKYKNLGSVSKVNSNSPPSVFVGSKLKYPLVNVGILSPLEKDENAWLYDDAKYWADKNFSIKEVVNLRDNLLNSRFQSQVQEARKKQKFVEIAQEIAIASKPVEMEIQLKKNIKIKKEKDRILTPQGMRAPLKKAKITENVKVDKKVDRVINEDIKSAEGLNYLYKNNFSEYVLSKILSIGVLGLKKDKRFVPTRWSITATDDTIGKKIISEIKNFKTTNDYELFFGSFMGNHYLILMMPNVWSYELFELYLPRSSWNPSKEIKAATDFESFDGRKTYASNCAGGYYASRLPILEHLKKTKRQAGVLAIRLETPSYWASLGVWVVRESVRKALKHRNLKFNSIEESKQSLKKISMIKFGFNPSQIIKQSKLLEQIETQRSLRDWF